MNTSCNPRCKYWIFLYYKNPTDFKAVCEHPEKQKVNQTTYVKSKTADIKIKECMEKCQHYTRMGNYENE